MDTLIEPILASERDISNLSNFLKVWENAYLSQMAKIPLFDTNKTNN